MDQLGKTIYEFEGFGFKFGMYARYITEKECGTSVNGLVKRMTEAGRLNESLLQYFYGAAVAYDKWKGIDRKLEYHHIAEFLEQIGDERSAEIFRESWGMPKNAEAPQTEGQTEKNPS